MLDFVAIAANPEKFSSSNNARISAVVGLISSPCSCRLINVCPSQDDESQLMLLADEPMLLPALECSDDETTTFLEWKTSFLTTFWQVQRHSLCICSQG
jgi:hypothetical protein